MKTDYATLELRSIPDPRPRPSRPSLPVNQPVPDPNDAILKACLCIFVAASICFLILWLVFMLMWINHTDGRTCHETPCYLIWLRANPRHSYDYDIVNAVGPRYKQICDNPGTSCTDGFHGDFCCTSYNETQFGAAPGQAIYACASNRWFNPGLPCIVTNATELRNGTRIHGGTGT